MKMSTMFALVVGVAAALLVASGCGSVGPAPITGPPPSAVLPTPAAKWLYVDHSGTLYEYRLPLSKTSKPVRALTEWPHLAFTPSIAVGPNGDVALASPYDIRLFAPPIVSFEKRYVKLTIPLTPAITEMGEFGAALADIEYDPNDDLWLLNNLGAGSSGSEVSELRPPFSRNMVASLTLAFDQPGSKTAGFATLDEARFDVNATLYVLASATLRTRLFKLGFPYAKQPSDMGIDLGSPDFVDSSQYLPTSKNPASVLLGQYYGPLRSPKPGSPPSPPVNDMSQFDEPLNYQNRGLFPNNIVNTVVDALAADAPRQVFYTLDLVSGRLDVYPLPLVSRAKPILSLPCLAGASNCEAHEHLFLSP